MYSKRYSNLRSLGFDVAKGLMNGVLNETRTHLYRFGSQAR